MSTKPPRPGCVSVLNGGNLLLEFERAAVLAGGKGIWFSAGPIRRALDAMTRAAGLDGDEAPGYLRVVRSIVANMIAHGREGILVISSGVSAPRPATPTSEKRAS